MTVLVPILYLITFVQSTTDFVPNINVYVINERVFVSHMTVFIDKEDSKQGLGV